MAACHGEHVVNAADYSLPLVTNKAEGSAGDSDEQARHQLAVGSDAPFCNEAESACDKTFCNEAAFCDEAECPADSEEKLAVAEGSTCDAAAAGNENASQLAVGSDEIQLRADSRCREEVFLFCKWKLLVEA